MLVSSGYLLATMKKQLGEHMNTQFGVPLRKCPKVKVDGYESGIPAVLEMLRRSLYAGGGHTQGRISQGSVSCGYSDAA